MRSWTGKNNIIFVRNNGRLHAARVIKQKIIANTTCLLKPTGHIYLSLHQPIFTCFDRFKTLWVEEFSWRKFRFISSSKAVPHCTETKTLFKTVEFYSKCIQELPDNCQEVISSNGEYVTENEFDNNKFKFWLNRISYEFKEIKTKENEKKCHDTFRASIVTP